MYGFPYSIDPRYKNVSPANLDKAIFLASNSQTIGETYSPTNQSPLFFVVGAQYSINGQGPYYIRAYEDSTQTFIFNPLHGGNPVYVYKQSIGVPGGYNIVMTMARNWGGLRIKKRQMRKSKKTRKTRKTRKSRKTTRKHS